MNFLFLQRLLRLRTTAKDKALNTPEWLQISSECVYPLDVILHEVIQPGFAFMTQMLAQELALSHKQISNGYQIGLILFLCGSFLFYVLGWIPYILRKERQVREECHRVAVTSAQVGRFAPVGSHPESEGLPGLFRPSGLQP